MWEEGSEQGTGEGGEQGNGRVVAAGRWGGPSRPNALSDRFAGLPLVLICGKRSKFIDLCESVTDRRIYWPTDGFADPLMQIPSVVRLLCAQIYQFPTF